MNEVNEEEILIRKKIDAFYLLAKPVHVVLNSGVWKNGVVTDVSETFFLLNERLEGEMPIFFQEVGKVEIFKEKGFYNGLY
jgi:hypothetical protein